MTGGEILFKKGQPEREEKERRDQSNHPSRRPYGTPTPYFHSIQGIDGTGSDGAEGAV